MSDVGEPPGRTSSAPGPDVLALSSESGRFAYDCELVALARILLLPLIPGDRALQEAFPGSAIDPDFYTPEHS